MLAVERDRFRGVHAQLGGSGGFLWTEAPSASSSDTQSNGQVRPWEEETGRGSCRALTQRQVLARAPVSTLPRPCQEASGQECHSLRLVTTRLPPACAAGSPVYARISTLASPHPMML